MVALSVCAGLTFKLFLYVCHSQVHSEPVRRGRGEGGEGGEGGKRGGGEEGSIPCIPLATVVKQITLEVSSRDIPRGA